MKQHQNISVGKKGMNRNSHPSVLEEHEYTVAFNANLSSQEGDGFPMLQNEHSNILSLYFDEGSVVMGFVKDLPRRRTYFILTNPNTGVSTIGYVSDVDEISESKDTQVSCGCNYIYTLDTPLECTTQTPTGVFTSILSDDCNLCLNLSIIHPITSIQLKKEKCGTVLYFTDNYNPPRYLNVDELGEYLLVGEETCDDEGCVAVREETCLDCEKLRIFPRFDKPCITPEVIQVGGNLRMGNYSFLLAYCDSQGNELSNYFSITNPVTIFDPNRATMNQTNLGDVTNYGVRLSVTDLDNRFGYYKVAVIENVSVNNTQQYYFEGVHPVSDKEVVYQSNVDKEATTLNHLLSVRTQYERTRLMAQSNNYLFQGGLTSYEEINLQPVVNLMGSFLRWNTSVAKEDLYNNGVNSAKYRGYMRGEVYPFSIRFYNKTGGFTSNFILPNRPADSVDLQDVDNTDSDSINDFAGSCDEVTRDKRWEIYNTASKLGVCPLPANAGGYTEITQTEVETCVVENVDTLLNFSWEIPYEKFNNFNTFVDKYLEFICEVGSLYYYADFCTKLETLHLDACETCGYDDVDENCGLYYDSENCSAPVAIVDTNVTTVGDSVNYAIEYVEKIADDYVFSDLTTYSNIVSVDEDGNNVHDTDFYDEWGLTIPNALYESLVFIRVNTNSNTDCSTTYTLSSTSPNFISYNFQYYASMTLSDLQLSKDSLAALPSFTNKLHKGAKFWKLDFAGEDTIVLEIPPRSNCSSFDTFSKADEFRYTTYGSCNTNNYVESDVFDLDTGIILILDRANYASDNIIIAIDTPIAFAFALDPTVLLGDLYCVMTSCTAFNITQREIEYTSMIITADELNFNKTEQYSIECTYQLLDIGECDAVPFEFGKFGYYESSIKYPCNEELYDSSTLTISPLDIPEDYRFEFEDNYVEVRSGDTYELKPSTNLCNKPIRHYRFPDNCLVPYMGEEKITPFSEPYIYPIGVSLDENIIISFLNIAKNNNLITEEQLAGISGYEVFRGDRTLHRGVIAKGLLFDTIKYEEGGEDWYYPNYPYNSLGYDPYNYLEESRDTLVPHPFDSESNNKFTFHSPNTEWEKPTLGSELHIEGYQLGNSKGKFVPVDDHSKWVILGSDAYTTANVLAGAEITFETTTLVGDYLVMANTAGVFGLVQANVFAGVAIAVSLVAKGIFRFGELRHKWLRVIQTNGKPVNLGYYYTSEGWYNRFLSRCVEGNKVRGISTSKYLKSGNHWIVDKSDGSGIKLNNTDREESVFLSLGEYNVEYDLEYKNHDNTTIDIGKASKFTASQTGICESGRSSEFTRNIGSPYASIRQWLPAQYGSVNSIKWIPTSHCGTLNDPQECLVVYGGDTYLSRMSLKRKIPFFYTNAYGLGDLTPFEYYTQRNIGYPKYYVNFNTEEKSGVGGTLFPDIRSAFNLDCEKGAKDFYVRQPSKMYLFSYGIPQFLVESEINLNYRYARNGTDENFYPNVSDYIHWTQEKNVPIVRRNALNYNEIYSRDATKVAAFMLPDNYSSADYKCLTNSENGVIYSSQDNSEQNLIDPYLNYKPLDRYQFDAKFGRLIDLRGIESNQVLARFENQIVLYNAVDTLRDRLTPENQELGSGGIFTNARPVTFNETDLGYAGTQHRAMVSCEFGHFFVDAKRGKVFQLNPNGEGLKEIGAGLTSWFKEHLPFKILKSNITGLEVEHTDNLTIGLGISMGWDARYNRIFVTKRDYIVNTKYRGDISYSDGEFIYGHGTVSLQDTEYFKDTSWTVAYSPLVQNWVSYYSFKPDYYIPHQNYFQTGLNSGAKGLWSHLLTNRSYQVFYGKKYGWLVELPVKNEYVNKILKSVNYMMDTRRYHNKYDFAEKRNVGFNKAWVYNRSQNTGMLELVPQERNNAGQLMDYPKQTKYGQQILASESNKKWTFNYLYNRVRNEFSNNPTWIKDTNDIGKTLSIKSLNYYKTPPDRMAGDWFLLRLAQDNTSQFKQILKWTMVPNIINPNG